MRFTALIIAAHALLAPTAGAHAEALTDRMVQLIEDVCIAPATAEAIVETGNRLAAAHGWTLRAAEPAPLPIMHNENGPKITFTSAWELAWPEGRRAGLFVSIIRPEMAGVKHSLCIVDVDTDLTGGSLERSVEQRLGARVIRDTSRRFHNTETWLFTDEKARGNCGRQITILYKEMNKDKPQTLMFLDMAFPNDGNWVGIASQAACR